MFIFFGMPNCLLPAHKAGCTRSRIRDYKPKRRRLRAKTAGGGQSPAAASINQRLYIVAAIAISFQT
jgi:hypothetical protein